MSPRTVTRVALVLGASLALLFGVGLLVLPPIGANALLHPLRRPMTVRAPDGCREQPFRGRDVSLQGWTCEGRSPRRGTLVYLHGVADNRASSLGIIRRFAALGFDVIAYDSRAHGDSGGDACTYGYFEKDDLRRVLDSLAPGPIVLVGNSLGASVALQEAANDSRVKAIVAISPFSDLRTIATERAPVVFVPGIIDLAFGRAEADGHFQVDAVSPVAAARSIAAPVLLVHGEKDVDTRPAHSVRILAALTGTKRLLVVPAAGHNDALPGALWDEIERWIVATSSR